MTAFNPKMGKRVGHRKLYHNKKTARQRRLRKQVVAGYGNQCVCCGETNQGFLTIDHVNNDGHEDEHRNKSLLYARIIRLGFPAEWGAAPEAIRVFAFVGMPDKEVSQEVLAFLTSC